MTDWKELLSEQAGESTPKAPALVKTVALSSVEGAITDERRAELISEYRFYNEQHYKVSDSFDKTILTLGGVGIAFCATFLKDAPKSSSFPFLFLCIAAFAIAMFFILFSQFCTQETIPKHIESLYLGLFENREPKLPDLRTNNKKINFSNKSSIVCIGIGVLCLGLALVAIYFDSRNVSIENSRKVNTTLKTNNIMSDSNNTKTQTPSVTPVTKIVRLPDQQKSATVSQILPPKKEDSSSNGNSNTSK